MISKIRTIAATDDFWSLKLGFDRLRSLNFYRVLFGLIITAFCSLAITFFVFRIYYGEFTIEQFEWFFQHERNRVFFVSFLIIFVLNLTLLGLLRSTVLANFLIAATSVIWLFVNQVKMESRQMPFLPEDLFLAGEAGEMHSIIKPEDVSFLVVALILIVMIALSGYFLKKLLTSYPKIRTKPNFLLSLLLISIGFGWLIRINYHIKDPQTMLLKDNFIGNNIIPWNQAINYQWNGPVIGFISNIGKISLDKPSDYSEKKIAQIVAKYSKLAHETNQTRQSPAEDPINIAVILSESMVDTDKLTDFYNFKQDPLPFFHQLLNSNSHGQLATSEYGGGTANVEFEILTGLSTTLNQNTTPFTHFVPKIKNFPSMAHQLKASGYQTNALHNFSPRMYKRNLTYPNLGIDNFLGIDDFKYAQSLGGSRYDSDYSFYKTLLDLLRQSPEQPKFINGVTMQNHAPYNNTYDINENFVGRDGLNDENEYHLLDNYLTGLNHTDKALAEFYNELQTIPERTLVVIYGDHFPGSNVFWRVNEYDPVTARKTPILILSNFGLPASELGDISGNFMLNSVFNLLNWRKSAFGVMLDKLQAEFPQMSFYHTNDPEKFTDSQIYRDYALIQYDLLNGQRFSQKLGFFDLK